jgi:hypothetical protein
MVGQRSAPTSGSEWVFRSLVRTTPYSRRLLEPANLPLKRWNKLDAYASERDLDHAGRYISAWLALISVYQGRWSDAADLASGVLQATDLAVVSRIMALVALGRLRARRGDPGAWALLDDALELASSTGTLQRLAPVRAARAEAAFLGGDKTRAGVEANAAWDLAIRHRHPWYAGEFAFWHRQAGAEVRHPPWIAPPYLLQLQGKWQEAALAWAERGCPYEQARALSVGDEAASQEALTLYDRLGARPAADALRQRLRREGSTRVSRGPRSATRNNPFGLTPRQAEILSLLNEGLTNARIARRLQISRPSIITYLPFWGSSGYRPAPTSPRSGAARPAKRREGKRLIWGGAPDVPAQQLSDSRRAAREADQGRRDDDSVSC